jgi:drug/metabolite transporter (DMT)-like permease
MKFHLMMAVTTLGAGIVVSTLGEPLLTDAVRTPLQVVVVLLAAVTWGLEWILRPKPGARPGALIRNVMLATLIKMGLVLTGILIYVVADFPDPKPFSLATYLIYAAFTAVLVAESMRHEVSPTKDI